MKATLERICEHCGIVRAGPECDHFGAPFENAVVVVFKGNQATMKALVTKPTVSQLKAACRELAKYGYSVNWDRVEGDSVRHVVVKEKRRGFWQSLKDILQHIDG